MRQPQPNNNFIPQLSFNMNYMQQPMLNPKDITDPTTAMNMELVLMPKAFKLNYSTPTNNNQKISLNPHNRQIAQSSMNLGQDRQMQMVRGHGGNQFRQYGGQNVGNQNRNGNVVAAQAEGNANENNDNQIRLWFRWISFDYRVTLGFGSIVGGLDHVNHVIRLPIEHGISRGTRVDMGDDVDISALTIEQYMALIQDKNRSGIVKPKIGDDVEFEININFMRELRRKVFAGTDDEDAHEHVLRVLEIVDLFHFPCVTHDAVMLRIFPIILKGRALWWKKGLPVGMINTWDLLEK
ncbi:hypothetical protein Tco_0803696 [Tanacetum coccineum]|uniref:Retrotransposon gag domain-containing protein n=1 Tax=Tanacetum coccineum TaxID=301880 RepID=A0ABQ5A6M3_9ASTR